MSDAAHTVKDSRSSEESKQTPAVLGSRGEKPAAAVTPDASQCDSEGATGSASQSSAARKREQAEEAVRRAEEAGHTLPDQAMRADSTARTYGPLARNRSLVARLRWWLLPRVGYYCDGTDRWRWHMRVARWAWVAAGWLPGSRLYD